MSNRTRNDYVNGYRYGQYVLEHELWGDELKSALGLVDVKADQAWLLSRGSSWWLMVAGSSGARLYAADVYGRPISSAAALAEASPDILLDRLRAAGATTSVRPRPALHQPDGWKCQGGQPERWEWSSGGVQVRVAVADGQMGPTHMAPESGFYADACAVQRAARALGDLAAFVGGRATLGRRAERCVS